MRLAGATLIVIGVAWVVLCFGGIAMMSRSVDYLTEAALPSLIGVALALTGLWILSRGH